jgi:hypothetical protein
MNFEEVSASVHKDILYKRLYERSDDTLWTLLYYAGYLTHGKDSNTLCIPNKEVMEEWDGWVSLIAIETLNYDSTISKLLEGDVDGFTKQLQNAIIESFSYFDVGGSKSGKKAESFYHGFVMGIAVMGCCAGLRILSNREGGLGRYDMLIEQTEKMRDAKAILIEFKVAKQENNIGMVTQAALEQVENRLYRVAVSNHVQYLIELGIAFEGKMVHVLKRIFQRDESENWEEVPQ